MGIRNSDAEIRTQEPSQPRKQHNRLNLIKIRMRKIKQVASNFLQPNVNTNKLDSIWLISINKAKYAIRTTNQTTAHDVTKPLHRLLKTRKSLFHCQFFWGRASMETTLLSVKYVQVNEACQNWSFCWRIRVIITWHFLSTLRTLVCLYPYTWKILNIWTWARNRRRFHVKILVLIQSVMNHTQPNRMIHIKKWNY